MSDTLKKNLNPLLIAGGGVAGVLLLSTCMCCGVVGLFNGGEEEETDGTAKATATAIDFIDNSEKYQGQELEFEMIYMLELKNGDFPSLRERRGHIAKFYLIADVGASADIFMRIPTDLDVPNLRFGNEAVVRFRCNDGDLIYGNVAIEIRRP